jgi:hypothetical protein
MLTNNINPILKKPQLFCHEGTKTLSIFFVPSCLCCSMYALLFYFRLMKKKNTPIKIVLVEFDEGGSHIFVNLAVNGKRCRFLVDTGASKSVIDKTFFEKYFDKKNLRTIQQETSGLHSSVPETYLGIIKKLSMGPLNVSNYEIAAVDLSHVNTIYTKVKKPKIHGILGSDLMLKNKMLLNYGDLTIKLG